MNRREAIKNALLGAGGVSYSLSQLPTLNPLKHMFTENQAIGVQLFTIPKMVDTDLAGTLSLLSEIGYKEVEFFGPYPFSDPVAIEGWTQTKGMMGLVNDAFYGFSVAEVVQMLKDRNLTVPSMHTDILTLRNGLDRMLDELAPFGASYLVLPALMDGRSSLDDYKKLVEEFNGFGEKMSAYDMKFVYHNHGYEHIEMDGEIPMDYLLTQTDPKYVAFELDIFWMSAAGADPISYLQKYPNRYKLLHLKDASAPVRFSGDGGTADQWMTEFPKMADPGDGVLKVDKIVKVAQEIGLQHYYLERDLAPQPEQTLRNSFANLSSMRG